jgi:hypothetical protein
LLQSLSYNISYPTATSKEVRGGSMFCASYGSHERTLKIKDGWLQHLLLVWNTPSAKNMEKRLGDP